MSELVLNQFELQNDEQLMNVQGGLVGEIIAGIVIGWVVDAVVEDTTGKSGSDHVSDGVNWVADRVKYAWNFYFGN